MNQNPEEEFANLLEKSEKEPGGYLQEIAKNVHASPDKYFPLLVSALDNNPVTMTPVLNELFSGHLNKLVSKLVFPLLNDTNLQNRFIWASNFLSENYSDGAAKHLINALSDTKKNIVLAAVKALAALRDADSIRALKDFFINSTDEVQLSASIRYLLPISDRISPEFIQNFDRYPVNRQIWIMKFLSESKVSEAFQIYVKSLREEPLILGIFAVAGLGNIGEERCVEILANVLSHKEWFLRKRAADALGMCHFPSSVPHLVNALTDSSIQIRTSAVESLSKIGNLNLDCLIDGLKNGDHNQKVGLIKAFGQIKSSKLVEPLINILSNRSTLFFSIDALGDIGDQRAVKHLMPFLKDEEWFNRLNALEALGKIRPPDIIETAKKCLEDPNDMVRNSAQRIIQQKN
ncbi:MAG: HEAT repeat domain-containing protein [Candidatus Riflebacteria bacterium]|nr:HEAT repeat domain-containing protein [Candidatus Riflebacteria bacterium]